MAKWTSGYTVVVAGRDVYETTSKIDAYRIKARYAQLGYEPIHVYRGPVATKLLPKPVEK